MSNGQVSAGKRIADAFATALENVLGALTSKKMLGMIMTGAALWAAQRYPTMQIIIGALGGAYQVAQGASDAIGKGKIEAEGKVEADKVIAANGGGW